MIAVRPRIHVWAIVVLLGGAANAQQTMLLFGDTHLHTSNSTDAYAGGNTTLGPEEAYRYARGLPVIHPVTGGRMRISRPLDFLVVADHSDYLGLQKYMQMDDPRLTATPRGRQLRELAAKDPGSVFRMIIGRTAAEFSREELTALYAPMAKQPWYDEIDAAERNNEPGVFTAFAGWEWSSNPGNRNLHRVVFSPSPAAALRSFFPFSNLDSERPEDLWAWLERTSATAGAEFVAIPHNSNMSTGLMFDMVDSDGRPITAEYARTRIRWEPVMEVTQVKGTSETLPELSPNDELAEFEIYRHLFFAAKPVPNAGDYARTALLRGLQIERNVGVNPYRFGMIGSSDIHTGTATLDESDFGGAVSRDIRPRTGVRRPRVPRGHGARGSTPGRCRHRAWPRSGRLRTRATRSRRRFAARRSTRLPARASRCACSADSASSPATRARKTSWRSAIAGACQWAEICRVHRGARHPRC